MQHNTLTATGPWNDGTLTLPGLTATAALKRKQVGVVAVAPEAEVRPPDGVPLSRVKNELSLSELHDARAQLVALIIHVGDLRQGRRRFTFKEKNKKPLCMSVVARDANI